MTGLTLWRPWLAACLSRVCAYTLQGRELSRRAAVHRQQRPGQHGHQPRWTRVTQTTKRKLSQLSEDTGAAGTHYQLRTFAVALLQWHGRCTVRVCAVHVTVQLTRAPSCRRSPQLRSHFLMASVVGEDLDEVVASMESMVVRAGTEVITQVRWRCRFAATRYPPQRPCWRLTRPDEVIVGCGRAG